MRWEWGWEFPLGLKGEKSIITLLTPVGWNISPSTSWLTSLAKLPSRSCRREEKNHFFFFHRETCHSQDFISKWIISGHCPKFSFGILLNWGITHYHWYNTVKPTTWINADLAYSILQSERLWIPHGGEHIHQDAFTIEKNISLKKLTKPASRELWKRIIYFHVKLRPAKGKANN